MRFIILVNIICHLVYIKGIEAVPAPAILPDKNNALDGRIVGGITTDIKNYPYQVSVRLDTYILLHICGGSIYGPKVILTAAHCIKGRFPSYIRVVAGSNTINDDTELGYRVIKLIPHPGYSKTTHENDIGLIILTEPLIYSNVIRPISLANTYPVVGSKGIVTGWGKNDELAETLTNLLQEVDVEIIDNGECNMKYSVNNKAITEQMLCAGSEDGGKDSCQGDSGGPLSVNGQLVGIVSWGVGCARKEFPGVYASIPYHNEWIKQTSLPYHNI